jgi:hypothetical protein
MLFYDINMMTLLFKEDDFEQVEMENVADESIILPDEEASSSKNGGSADIQTLNSTSTNSTPSRRSSASDSKPSSTKSTPKNGKSTFSERSETGGPKNGSRTRAAANTSVAPEEAHLAPEEKEPEQRRSPRQRVRARLQD